MRKPRVAVLSAAFGITAVFLALGCSGDDDKGTSASKLTPEEQYELLAQFVDVDTATIGTTIAPLIVAQAGVNLWDGVDSADFGELDLGLGLIPGLVARSARHQFDGTVAKRPSLVPEGVDVPAILSARAHQLVREADEIDIHYDIERGWWFAVIDLSEDFDSAGASFSASLSIRDSIRFDNSTTGTPSIEPNEQTDRFQHGTSITVGLELVFSDLENDVAIDFSIDGQSAATVTGLNSANAVVNGSSSLALGIDAAGSVEDTESLETMEFDIQGDLDLTALVDDLLIPLDEDDQPECPTSGSVEAGLGINLSVLFGDESGTAEGDWSITIDMLGDGFGHVEIQSGDFVVEGTTLVCEP